MAQAVIIDIAIAAVWILFTIWGAQRGLLKSVAGLVILLASLLGALVVSNVVTPFISAAVQPMVVETVESKLSELAEEIAAKVMAAVEAEREKQGAFKGKNAPTLEAPPTAVPAVTETKAPSVVISADDFE